MFPDEDSWRRWGWALQVVLVFLIGVAFGFAGSCWITGCSSPPLREPDVVIVESVKRLDAAAEAEASHEPPPEFFCPPMCPPSGEPGRPPPRAE
jgi:hypothetical protein